jgi:low temperature requirement protein LtrA
VERTTGWTQALVTAKVAVVGAGGQAQSCSLYNAAVAQRTISTTEDQSATFIELFFDLVFVYAVTQTVSLLHEDLSWAGLWHAVVVFWLVWWAWTQYTWALNSADTTHPAVDAVMLVATAIAFLMAVTIPDAFGDAGGWFAATYIAVRLVGLGLYGRVAWDDVAKRTAVRRFAVLSLGGLAAVAAGGVVGGEEARAWWWAAAVVLDVAAAVGAGTAEGWDIRPEHFGERHGLFVIIALGESLIVAAAGLTGAERTAQTVAVAILAVATTGGLWWSYFVSAKPALDHALPPAQRRRPIYAGARRVQHLALSSRLRGRAAGGGHRGGGNSSARSAAGGRQPRPRRGRSPVRGQCCRRTPPERLLAVRQTVGDPRCRRRRRLGHARRGSHLVAPRGGPRPPAPGCGGAPHAGSSRLTS